MANLNDDKVVDVILGEAASVAKYGVEASYQDMLAIASVIANRSNQLSVPAKDVVSVKSEFNAQSPAPGMAAYRGLAEKAIQEVMTNGPVHSATFYSTPATTGNLPSGLQPETQTAAHSYFSDPLGRSINTAKGYVEPVSFSVPTPTPSPIGASAGLLGTMAEPQATQAAFAAPATAVTDPDLPERSYTVSNMNPILGPSNNISSMAASNAPANMQGLLGGLYQSLEGQFQEATGRSMPAINDAIAKSGTSRETDTPNSMHFSGRALDLSTRDLSDPEKAALIEQAIQTGWKGFGLGSTIAHLDDGRQRSWSYNNPTYAGIPVADWNEALARGTVPDAARTMIDQAFTNVARPDMPTPTSRSQALTTQAVQDYAREAAKGGITNLSGTNTQNSVIQSAPVQSVTRGGSLPDIATTIDPGRLGAVTNASSTLAAAAPQVATGTSALSTTAPATGLLDSIALGAAPVGQPSSSLASTATGATNTASNSPANAYGALASSLSQAGLTNLSGTTQTQAPSVVTAAPVSTPAPAATPAPTSVPTTTAPTASKTDADFRSGRDKDRAAFDPDPNAKDQGMKVSIAPTVGRVAGGLLGSMVAGPIGGLLGATLGGKIGSGELGLGGLLGSMAENTEAFSIDNPSGSGRGLLDVSKGPVSIGSLTATAAPNSGGYRSVDSNTGWTSYTSPLGITTTMVGDNIVGGPGLSPAAGGNAAGFK